MQQETKSPEQQRYIQLIAQSKKLYQAQTELDDVQAGMSQANDAASMMQMGYRLHQSMQMVREVANSMYQEKMTLESKHPEFKAEAQAYGKQQQQKREQSQQQSF
ncbi:MAG: hypothetical protein ABJH28_12490 [Paraglaciecola sp.]|uniref:hypothetical protein n=1 Tax=Paraglaciecola sp. TaxID=1920173 RepID=UPI003264C026